MTLQILVLQNVLSLGVEPISRGIYALQIANIYFAPLPLSEGTH